MTNAAITRGAPSHPALGGVALLLGLLGSACTSSDGASPNDGGASADGAPLGSGLDGASPSDGAGASADGAPLGSRSDGASPGDGAGADGALPPNPGNGAAITPVRLGTAGSYAILAKSGVSTVPTSAITGNVGVSPAAATYVTGFALTMDATNVFATSPQVTGMVYASDYAPPTPSNLTTSVGDMEIAFSDAAGRAASVTELGAGNIGGMTLSPGVYKWGTGLMIPTSVTLAGHATDVWIFQIAQGLTMSSATSVVLSGGAVAKNVFWQVAGAADLGTTAHFEGILLSQTSITLRTGASVNGRLFSQTAVNIDSSVVVQPAP